MLWMCPFRCRRANPYPPQQSTGALEHLSNEQPSTLGSKLIWHVFPMGNCDNMRQHFCALDSPCIKTCTYQCWFPITYQDSSCREPHTKEDHFAGPVVCFWWPRGILADLQSRTMAHAPSHTCGKTGQHHLGRIEKTKSWSLEDTWRRYIFIRFVFK